MNACEVKAYLIAVGNTLAPSVSGSLYPLGYTWLLLLSCVTVCVVSLLPCVTDCYMLYNIVCKVERFVLTN